MILFFAFKKSMTREMTVKLLKINKHTIDISYWSINIDTHWYLISILIKFIYSKINKISTFNINRYIPSYRYNPYLISTHSNNHSLTQTCVFTGDNKGRVIIWSLGVIPYSWSNKWYGEGVPVTSVIDPSTAKTNYSLIKLKIYKYLALSIINY